MKTEHKIYAGIGVALFVILAYLYYPNPFRMSLEELDTYCQISCEDRGYPNGLTHLADMIDDGIVACEEISWCNNLAGSPRCCCCRGEHSPGPAEQCSNDCEVNLYDGGYLTSGECVNGEYNMGADYSGSRCCCFKVGDIPGGDLLLPLALVVLMLMFIALYYIKRLK